MVIRGVDGNGFAMKQWDTGAIYTRQRTDITKWNQKESRLKSTGYQLGTDESEAGVLGLGQKACQER